MQIKPFRLHYFCVHHLGKAQTTARFTFRLSTTDIDDDFVDTGPYLLVSRICLNAVRTSLGKFSSYDNARKGNSLIVDGVSY